MDKRRRAIRQERFLHGRVANGRKPANCRINNIVHQARGSSRAAPPSVPDFEPVAPRNRRIASARYYLLRKSITAPTEPSRGNDGDLGEAAPGATGVSRENFRGVPKRSGAFTGAKS
jgi:hypothetical protein